MIVCVCHRVSDRDIASEAAHGCASFAELQDNTRIGTGCGACLELAEESFAAHAGGGCRDHRGCAEALPGAAAGAAGVSRESDRAPLAVAGT